jgi:hypothetical protein
LKKIENLTIPENTTLVTMDVTFLYTNISHDDGITACRNIWEQQTVVTSMVTSVVFSGMVKFSIFFK